MARFSILLILAGLAGAVYGGHKMWVSMKNDAPISMSYAQWRQAPPEGDWLDLSEVHLDYSASVRIDIEHTRRGGSKSVDHEYYVACWGSDEDPAPVLAFLKVEDASKQQLMEECWAHDGNEEWLSMNAARIYEVTSIRGLAQSGLDLNSEDQRLLTGLSHVDPGFKIIERNKEPEGGIGTIMFFGGLVGMLAGGFLLFTGRKKQAPAYPAAYPQASYPQPAYPQAAGPMLAPARKPTRQVERPPWENG